MPAYSRKQGERCRSEAYSHDEQIAFGANDKFQTSGPKGSFNDKNRRRLLLFHANYLLQLDSWYGAISSILCVFVWMYVSERIFKRHPTTRMRVVNSSSKSIPLVERKNETPLSYNEWLIVISCEWSFCAVFRKCIFVMRMKKKS